MTGTIAGLAARLCTSARVLRALAATPASPRRSSPASRGDDSRSRPPASPSPSKRTATTRSGPPIRSGFSPGRCHAVPSALEDRRTATTASATIDEITFTFGTPRRVDSHLSRPRRRPLHRSIHRRRRERGRLPETLRLTRRSRTAVVPRKVVAVSFRPVRRRGTVGLLR